MTPAVVTVGEVLAAFVAEDGLALPLAQHFVRIAVGAEANVAIGLARLSHDVAFAGRVGDDANGQFVVRALRAEGVDVTHLVTDDARPTGVLMRDAALGRAVTVNYRRDGSAGSALCAADLDGLQLSAVRVLHVSGITAVLSDSAHDAVLDLVSRARGVGVHVVLDPNVRQRLAPLERWRRAMSEMVPLADTVLAGVDELPVVGDVDALLAAGPTRVVVKDGAAGATEHGADGTRSVPARAVPTVDPVGAGDAFAAGWISGWLDGVSPDSRLERAAAVASCVVACLGDTAGLPDRRALEALRGSADVDR